MTTRMLSGVQRVGPDEWRWGCWAISRVPTWPVFGREKSSPWIWWIAIDDVSDLTEDQYMEREISKLDARGFMETLSDRGSAPLDAGGIAALQEHIDQRDAFLRERAG